MRKGKLGLKILLIVLIIWIVLIVLPRPKSYKGVNPLAIKQNEKPFLIAHGGGNKEFPDNTLEAFYNAYHIDNNVMMETDVSITKDGVVLLSHDTTLDRKTNLLNALISEVNYNDLITEEVDFGYHNDVEPNSNGFNVSGKFIKYKTYENKNVTPLDVTYPIGVSPRHNEKFLATTLEELIKAFPNNKINVEIKQEGEIGRTALKAVIKLMDDLDGEFNTYERIVLASFHKEIFSELETLHKKDNRLMYSPGTQGVVKYYILQFLGLDIFYNDKISVLQIPMSQSGIHLDTKRLVKNAHKHNIAVHYWTIDNEEDMKKLIEIGADGIMTNVPSKLKEVYDEVFGN